MTERAFEADVVDESGDGASFAQEPPAAPATGDAGIDEVLEGLSALDESEVDDHPAVYSGIHEALRDALTSPQDVADQDA